MALQLGLEPLPADMRALLKARRDHPSFSKEGVAVCGMRRLGEAFMPGPSLGASHGLVAVCSFCVQHVRAGRESSEAPLGREQWSSSWGEQRVPLALPQSHPSRPAKLISDPSVEPDEGEPSCSWADGGERLLRQFESLGDMSVRSRQPTHTH